jgi:hypothetical protein
VGRDPSQDCRRSFPPGLCRLKSVRRPPAQAGLARRRGQPDVPPTRAYAERRRAEDKTTKEIGRCIKRYLARHLYRAQPRLTNTRLTNNERHSPVFHELAVRREQGPVEVVIGIGTDRGLFAAALVTARYQVFAVNPMSVPGPTCRPGRGVGQPRRYRLGHGCQRWPIQFPAAVAAGGDGQSLPSSPMSGSRRDCTSQQGRTTATHQSKYCPPQSQFFGHRSA